MKILLNWFKINSLKANPEKFQFMIMGKGRHKPMVLEINSFIIKEATSVKLLGITIDNCLTFSKYIDDICRVANYKLLEN